MAELHGQQILPKVLSCDKEGPSTQPCLGWSLHMVAAPSGPAQEGPAMEQLSPHLCP